MEKYGITILGLGPGNPGLITRQAWRILEDCSEIYLRTRQHPVVDGLPDQLRIHSYDHLYNEKDSFETVYSVIVEDVIALGHRAGGVVYAVPGHPFIAEATAPEIARRASQQGLPLQIVDGLSFLEPTLAALGLDAFPHTALVDALELASSHTPPFPPDAPALIAQLYSRPVASNVKLTLMSLYPDEHPVNLVHAAGTQDQNVESLALYEIDRSPHIGALTTLYVPPLGPATSFEAFQEIVAHLRAPDGCPWDREQTHQSLRSSLLEETYEVLSALDSGDAVALKEELGDLLLQIFLHSQIASEEGEFTTADVLSAIHRKIIHRHPHVFGDKRVGGVRDVLENWERLKAAERAANGETEKSLLDGVPAMLPSLAQADQYLQRAARVGFDWPDIQHVLKKLEEELGEVNTARSEEERSIEIGDLLFAVANLARWHHVDPESALRLANARFRRRFAYMEILSRQQGRTIADLSLDEMLSFWQQAKRNT